MSLIRAVWVAIVRRFRSDRFFRKGAPFASPGWYFDVRGAQPIGPYPDRAAARAAAAAYARRCMRAGDAGGRQDEVAIEAISA